MKLLQTLGNSVTKGAKTVGNQKFVKRLAVATAAVLTIVVLAQEGGSTSPPTESHERHGDQTTVATEAYSADNDTAQSQRRTIRAQHAIYNEDLSAELQLGCTYRVNAAFGVSVFTDTDFSSKRIVRLNSGTEVEGSCHITEGGKALSCKGLTLDNEWIRVRSGTIIGWAPSSCLDKQT
ncbi:hypothetical protein [Haloglycomyces albus]|uniref:hypothetical protein n=1 Tax=Haloglycomyces albus TaxID=526067 RepID=UPI00046D2FD7|nr:hypothetical protein [Haloglycomyces albus]